MPFIQVDSEGRLVAVSHETPNINIHEWEEVTDTDPRLAAFVAGLVKSDSAEHSKNALQESDLEFVRVVEDLIDLLVSKNYIQFTDLPDVAQQKFRQRRSLRGKMRSGLDLLEDSDDQGFL